MMLEKYCRDNHYTIKEVYIDDGYSGLNFDRPAFKQLLCDIESGYYSYQNGHSFGQGALNVGLTAGKNILVYKVSTGVATVVGTWTGAVAGGIARGLFAGIKYGLSAGKIANSVSGLNKAKTRLNNVFKPLRNVKSLANAPFSGANIAKTVGNVAANYNSAYSAYILAKEQMLL